MSLDMKQHHTIFGGQFGSPTVLQNGVLYTMAGQRLPDGVDPSSLDGYHIHPDYRYLLEGPRPEEVLNHRAHGPQIEGFAESEVRQALLMLKLLKARGDDIDDVASEQTIGDIALATSNMPEEPVPDDAPDLLAGVEEFVRPSEPEKFEERKARGIIERKPKGSTGKIKIVIGRKAK